MASEARTICPNTGRRNVRMSDELPFAGGAPLFDASSRLKPHRPADALWPTSHA